MSESRDALASASGGSQGPEHWSLWLFQSENLEMLCLPPRLRSLSIDFQMGQTVITAVDLASFLNRFSCCKTGWPDRNGLRLNFFWKAESNLVSGKADPGCSFNSSVNSLPKLTNCGSPNGARGRLDVVEADETESESSFDAQVCAQEMILNEFCGLTISTPGTNDAKCSK